MKKANKFSKEGKNERDEFNAAVRHLTNVIDDRIVHIGVNVFSPDSRTKNELDQDCKSIVDDMTALHNKVDIYLKFIDRTRDSIAYVLQHNDAPEMLDSRAERQSLRIVPDRTDYEWNLERDEFNEIIRQMTKAVDDRLTLKGVNVFSPDSRTIDELNQDWQSIRSDLCALFDKLEKYLGFINNTHYYLAADFGRHDTPESQAIRAERQYLLISSNMIDVGFADHYGNDYGLRGCYIYVGHTKESAMEDLAKRAKQLWDSGMYSHIKMTPHMYNHFKCNCPDMTDFCDGKSFTELYGREMCDYLVANVTKSIPGFYDVSVQLCSNDGKMYYPDDSFVNNESRTNLQYKTAASFVRENVLNGHFAYVDGPASGMKYFAPYTKKT